jgi:hypothetical protein
VKPVAPACEGEKGKDRELQWCQVVRHCSAQGRGAEAIERQNANNSVVPGGTESEPKSIRDLPTHLNFLNSLCTAVAFPVIGLRNRPVHQHKLAGC